MDQDYNPSTAYDDVVVYYKLCARDIQSIGIDTLIKNPDEALEISDGLHDPKLSAPWITAQSEPILHTIRTYVNRIDHNHTDRDSWEKLLKLIDIL